MTNQTTVNGYIYTSFVIEVKGRVYDILKVEGKRSYYNVNQRNHVRNMGKDFQSFEEMISNYKSMTMKAAIMQIVK